MAAKKTKEQAEKELALINGEWGQYLKDSEGNRRTTQEAVRDVTKDLVQLREKAKIVLAEMLNTIYHEEYYNTWGYDSFMDYVEKELEFQYRQAMYLVEIWDALVNKRGIPVDVMRKSTWSKLKEVVRSCKVEEVETDDIITLIEDSGDMTVEEVAFKSKELVHVATKSAKKPEKACTVTFKLWEEQYENLQKAIDAAAEVSGSKKSGANLDLICTSFIASHITGDPGEELKRIAKLLEKGTGCKILIVLDEEVVHANPDLDSD